MAAINNDDFIDFDGINKGLDRLDKRFAQWGKGVMFVYDLIHEKEERFLDDLKKRESAIKSVNVKSPNAGASLGVAAKDVESTISSIEKLGATMNSLTNYTDISEKSLAELRQVVSSLKKEYDALDPSATDFASEQARISGQVKVATQAIKAQEVMMKQALRATNDLTGSYNKLSKETNDLKAQLRALPGAYNLATGAINKNNQQAVIWQKTIERNEAALRKMDATMGNYHRNVGNYSSATSALANTFRESIVQILGVSTAFEALSKGLKVIDQMTRLRLSLEAVSESSRQVTARWDLISALADKTGQDVIKLTDSYVSFTAAARSTALEGKKADEIFTSFAGAFSALGKSSEVAERGLYAIQQMISKGKVSSEELNQQLAEALPGANKLFADALKVSTAELSDMLKKGEVLSVDVLPKVAKALEQIYGERAQQNTKTISGSWTRLTNQFVQFLDMFNQQAGIAEFFAGINNRLADTFKGVNRILKTQGVWAAFWSGSKDAGLARNDQDVLDSFYNKDAETRMGEIRVQQDLLYKSAKKLQEFGKGNFRNNGGLLDFLRSDDYKEAKADFVRRKALVEDMIKLNKNIKRTDRADNTRPAPTSSGGGGGDDGSGKRKLTQFEKLTKEAEKYRDIIIDDLLADSKAGRALEPSDEALAKWKELYDQIRVVSDAVGDQIPANLRELNAKLTKQPEDIASSIPIISMEKEDKPVADASEIIDLTKYNALLQVHEEENELLKNKIGQYGILRYVSKDYLDQLLPEQQKIQELEKQYAVEQIEAKKQAINEEIQLEKQKFQQIMELARAEAQGKRELQQASFELAVESSNAIFKIISDQREADRESLQMQMEHELSLVQGNEAAQERIKKEYAKKDLELRQKQARLEKAQAAFSIGISTARAVVNALATGGPPWIGIALAAIVGAMGAIQLAAVLAKPLPQFFKGTDNAPAGPAWIAERGPEIVESKGKQTLVQKKSIIPLRRGDKVYTAAETRAIMASHGRREGVGQMFDRTEASRARREDIYRAQAALNGGSKAQAIDYDKVTESFGKALDSRPVDQTFIDEQGVHRRYIRKNSTTTYHNSRYSLK